MGLFDKKICDICGEKIGLLGNRKLDDGNLCKDCAKKLSPWFEERRHSTVEDIKRQLEYREKNKKAVMDFCITRQINTRNYNVFIDDNKGNFTVARKLDVNENPDIVPLSAIVQCRVDVDQQQHEETYTKDGETVSYQPPVYKYEFDYTMRIKVRTQWFDDMDFRLNTFSISSDKRRELMEVEQTAYQIIAALTPNAAGMQSGMTGMNMNAGMQSGMSGMNMNGGMQPGMPGMNMNGGMQPGMNMNGGMQPGMTGMNMNAGMQSGMPGMNMNGGMQPGMPGMNMNGGMQPGMTGMNMNGGMQPGMTGMNMNAGMQSGMSGMNMNGGMQPGMSGMNMTGGMQPGMSGMNMNAGMQPGMPGMNMNGGMQPGMTGMNMNGGMQPGMSEMNMNGGMQSGMSGMQQNGSSWKCQCGAENTGKFCEYCGQPRPF